MIKVSVREKHRARVLAREAKNAGKLVAPEGCEKCGETVDLHMHHDDYSKPLEIIWVCYSCHRDIHAAQPRVKSRPEPETCRPARRIFDCWRAARTLLGWSQQHVADLAGIALNTLNSIERGTVDPKKSTWDKIVQVFAENGVEFIPDGGASLDGGEGLRLRKRP